MEKHMIYPGETGQVNYWLKRWGISKEELNEAILETGSLGRTELRKYLQRKKIPLSFAGMLRYLRLHLL